MWTRTWWVGLGVAASAVAVVLWLLVLASQPPGEVLVWAGVLVLLVIALAIRAVSTDEEGEREVRQLDVIEQFQAACANASSDNNLVVRAGGFYALGMIWRDWPAEHQRILDFIQAWLHTHAVPDGADPIDGRNVRKPGMDVAAAAKELLRRPARPERDPVDLSGCALSGLDLSAARLPGIVLVKTELVRARLTDTVLTGADLNGAVLVDADLSNAQLDGTVLWNARLDRAALTGADLSGANLQRAHLVGATLTGANLTGANLHEAILNNTDLHEVIGLTAEQLASAEIDSSTRLPAGIDREMITRSQRNRRLY